MAGKYEIDMLDGPLFSKIIKYTFPLMAAGILQLLFNTADMIVVGRYAGSNALGAVGATSSLINLLINVFMGLSVGASVAIAHYYGAGRYNELSVAIHTAIALSLVCGAVLLLLGQVISSPMLKLMGTPEDILPLSVSYMKVYFLGMPVMLLYNFGAAILRAVGDTRRPLYYLMTAGVINIILNLIFVIGFNLSVKGVAWATIISQAVSAGLIVRCLIKNSGPCRLEIKKLCLDKAMAGRIARVGLPAGFQGAVFSISNVLIQSSVNSFGAVAVAGNTAQCNLEGFVYNSMNSFHQTALSFTGQNTGAKKMGRVQKVFWMCGICVTVTGLVMGLTGLFFGRQLLSIYTGDTAVIDFGLRRMAIIFPTYFLCGLMEVAVGVLRGMGFSIMPMTVSLLGACGFRILWIMTAFSADHTPEMLYYSYPLSWLITAVVHIICLFTLARKKYIFLKAERSG
ncbi:MAG: MATE family efflux transporter [Lachnospiraceae bacterium]|nr:MATE family efflux transporter [Lachnospiraceae bacterium]